MTTDFIVIFIILAFLGLERLTVLTTTKKPSCIRWYQKLPFLHPNGISLIRIPMGLIATLFAAYGHWVTATLWFAVFMITDLSDGTIARNCDLQSDMGKWLDPLSDKCMYFPVLVFLSCGNVFPFGLTIMPFSWVLAFIIIDILGQMSRLFVKKTAANSFGKVKTALVTVILSLISFNQIHPLNFGNFVLVNDILVYSLTVSITILAFLSFYCKVIPDCWYANSFTFANFCCGIASIVFAFLSRPYENTNFLIYSYLLVFIGQFFDLFDGRMARKYGSTPHGAVFDDIADATSFGCGIASLIFCSLAWNEVLISPAVAAAIAVFYALCLFYRLYRFLHPTQQMPQGVFQGMPAPAGAIFAGSAVLFALLYDHAAFGILAASLVILSSLLMISTIPYRHFGQVIWPNMPKGIKSVIFIFMIVFVCFTIAHRNYRSAFVWWCSGLSLCYAILGINRKKRSLDS